MSQIWSSRDLEQILEPNDWMRLREQVRSRAANLQPIATSLKSRLRLLGDVRSVVFDVYGTLLISDAGELGLVASENTKGLQPAQNKLDAELDALDREVLRSLPKMLRSALREDFAPTVAIRAAIEADHKRRKNPKWPCPEVDIVSLWQQVLLSELNKDMQASLSPFILARFALEYELLHNRVQLMPGALELLHWLAARNFYIGIISNAQFYTPLILSTLLGLESLSQIDIRENLCFWSYLEGCSKPQQLLFSAASAALSEHGVEPGAVLYVGNDMRNDVWGAAQAGFRTALFAGDQRSLRLRSDMAELAEVQPDLIISELGQLKSVL